ncbi:ABC transporter permease [Agrobacterium tumefaciens]|uniref:ABC transporter permease n=1 Tax=Agrobacterium tumefaciens TaxID=358 RepID=UPI001572E1E6|nr:ABC transporter permease [Agrobacterium tumefaciens]NTE68236.1 ABC transporter permease [Agrobacterium tumefaciens]
MSILIARKDIMTVAARGTKGTWVAGVVVILILILAVVGPWIAPQDPNAANLMATNAGPSAVNWFGTDDIGRDILSRLLHGAQLSIVGPFTVMLISMTIGTTIAFVSVWFGGRVDVILGGIVDINLAFPSLLLAILAVSVFGAGIAAPSIALSIAYAPYCARQIRGVAMKECSLPYVEALEIQGAGGVRICLRHILPNIAGMLIALAALTFSFALVDLAAISYLGFGIQPPQADWGSMVAQGQLGIQQGAPQAALAGGGAILLASIAFNVLGEGILALSEARQ